MSVVKHQQIFEIINTLPDDLVVELTKFIDYLQYKLVKEGREGKNQSLEEFNQLADRLADEYEELAGNRVPQLSDYAISRDGIYEDHP